MENEKIVNKISEYSVNIAGGKVESLRIMEDMKTVVRVYDGGNVGIAGRIGEGDDAALEAEAKEKLAQKISYPCNLPEGKKRQEKAAKTVIPAKDFVRTVKKLISRLNAAYPDFIFSNKINMTEYGSNYSNSRKSEYGYTGSALDIMLVIKAKNSANIMDLDYGASRNFYDEDKIVEDIGKLLDAYNKQVEMPEDVPVIISYAIMQYALPELFAEKYMSGSSLFNGMLGEKKFDVKVNIYTDRAPDNENCIPFFDSEGTVSEGDRFYFVKDGVISGLATYKRSAENFNLPLSGGAYAEFDGVPMTSFQGVKVGFVGGELKDIVKGKAIYVACNSGGDMTPDGNLGIPVQLAYLYEDGKLLGKLPEFTLSANIFDVLGKDFKGCALNDVFSYSKENVLITKFKINKAN